MNKEPHMQPSAAAFIQVPPGASADLTDVFEGTWHRLDVLSLEGEVRHALTGGTEQYLIFVMNGRGRASWNDTELALRPGSALGVPEGEVLELRADSGDSCEVAVVTLAGARG